MAGFGLVLVSLDQVGLLDVILILLISGVLALLVRWDKGRRRRPLESAALYEDEDEVEDRLPIDRESEDEGSRVPHLYAVGMNGQILVDDDYVRIFRKGVMGHVGRGLTGLLGRGVQIHLSDVEDIEIIYPGLTQ